MNIKCSLFCSTILLSFLLPATTLFAQSKIKDGSVTGSGALPSSNAILELESASKGFLLPRITLSSTTSFAPLSAHVEGITVYNTATTGDVVPGYYYNDGAKWIRLADAAAADQTKDAWVDDHANAEVKLGYLSNGTTARADSAAFVVKDNGYVGIGTRSPQALLAVAGTFSAIDTLPANQVSRIYSGLAPYGTSSLGAGFSVLEAGPVGPGTAAKYAAVTSDVVSIGNVEDITDVSGKTNDWI